MLTTFLIIWKPNNSVLRPLVGFVRDGNIPAISRREKYKQILMSTYSVDLVWNGKVSESLKTEQFGACT